MEIHNSGSTVALSHNFIPALFLYFLQVHPYMQLLLYIKYFILLVFVRMENLQVLYE